MYIFVVVELVRDKHLWFCKLRVRGGIWGTYLSPPPSFFWLFHLEPDLSEDNHIPLLTSGPAVSTTHSAPEHFPASPPYYFLQQSSLFSTTSLLYSTAAPGCMRVNIRKHAGMTQSG